MSPVESRNDPLLRAAIADRRLIALTYDGLARTVEPHDYGVSGGVHRLLARQIAGASRSGRPLGWRLLETSRIADLRVLGTHFPGPRETSTGRHKPWEEIIASVSMPPGPAPRRG